MIMKGSVRSNAWLLYLLVGAATLVVITTLTIRENTHASAMREIRSNTSIPTKHRHLLVGDWRGESSWLSFKNVTQQDDANNGLLAKRTALTTAYKALKDEEEKVVAGTSNGATLANLRTAVDTHENALYANATKTTTNGGVVGIFAGIGFCLFLALGFAAYKEVGPAVQGFGGTLCVFVLFTVWMALMDLRKATDSLINEENPSYHAGYEMGAAVTSSLAVFGAAACISPTTVYGYGIASAISILLLGYALIFRVAGRHFNHANGAIHQIFWGITVMSGAAFTGSAIMTIDCWNTTEATTANPAFLLAIFGGTCGVLLLISTVMSCIWKKK